MSENKVEYTVRPTSVISMPVEERDKLVAEIERLQGIIVQAEMADDVIYKNYQRLLAALPQCPDHGACEPYAIDWVKTVMTELPQLRKWLFYLVERVPIDADPKLTEIAAYVQEHWRRGEFKE